MEKEKKSNAYIKFQFQFQFWSGCTVRGRSINEKIQF